MTHDLVRRAAATALLGAAGLGALAGTASAATSPVDSPKGSTDVADYNTRGTESAHQPSTPYFDQGPVSSALDQVYGLAGDPVDGLLRGNLPIPTTQGASQDR
jgi:hypothetical protein